jgi:hypothetical protein
MIPSSGRERIDSLGSRHCMRTCFFNVPSMMTDVVWYPRNVCISAIERIRAGNEGIDVILGKGWTSVRIIRGKVATVSSDCESVWCS